MQCKNCKKFFLLEKQENKTYPLKIILKAISTYNLGYNLNQVSKLMSIGYRLSIPISTISSWINEYKGTCTFARLRKEAAKLYNPKSIIFKKPLSHIQPYAFKCHKAKLCLLLKENPQFAAFKDYMEKISAKGFPHHIFTYNKNNSNSQRASQLKFNHLQVYQIKKQNQANQLGKISP